MDWLKPPDLSSLLWTPASAVTLVCLEPEFQVLTEEALGKHTRGFSGLGSFQKITASLRNSFYQPQITCEFISNDPDGIGWGKNYGTVCGDGLC